MSARKLGAIRQLSLQCETSNLQTRKPKLKKQYSEDIPDTHSDHGIRISVSAKNSPQNTDRPIPIKLAWGENIETERHQTAVENESILYSRQELAERLRNTWHTRDRNKQNLSIFIAHSVDEDIHCEQYNNEILETKPNEPKIMPLITRDAQETDFKSIFHKQIRKNNHSATTSATAYFPSRIDDKDVVPRTNAIVVVPIIEHPKPKPLITPKPNNESEFQTQTSDKSFNLMVRPNTAASKRDMFKNRTNSAFHGSIKNEFRPALIRASSVPIKTQAKTIFPVTKKRIKVTKQKSKNVAADEDEKTDAHKKSDVVTMVSLVSPTGSDNEEETIPDSPKPKSPKKISLPKKEEHQKNVSLRKTVKSVSFQQSSIHSIRSFSASFPSRRGSVATTMLLGNAVKKLNGHIAQKNNEKRAPVDDQFVEPKRRLVRSASVTAPVQQESEANAKPLTPDSTEQVLSVNEHLPDAKPEEPKEETVERLDPKEKECWDAYSKMNERGISISFDTILRGMLTPTEYRLRSKLAQSSDIPDDCR